MATSNSTDFTLTTSDVVNEILENAGILGIGQTPATRYYTSTVRTVNLMLKEWQVDGIYLWLERPFTVFLTPDQASYQLGGSGADRAVTSYTKTEISADEDVGQTTLSVDSSSGMSANQVIGIELDDGTMQWTTISSAPTSTTVVVNDALTGAASTDNNVYFYSTSAVISRPLEISSVVLRDDSNNDLILTPISAREYDKINNKTTSNNPLQYYVDKQRDYTKLYVWPTSNKVSSVLNCRGKRLIEDLDSATNNLDVPNEFLSAIIYNGAKRIAIKNGRSQALSELVSGSMSLAQLADETYRKLKRASQEYTRIRIRPRVYPED